MCLFRYIWAMYMERENMQIADNLKSACCHLRSGNRRFWSVVITLLISLLILLQMVPTAFAEAPETENENPQLTEEEIIPNSGDDEILPTGEEIKKEEELKPPDENEITTETGKVDGEEPGEDPVEDPVEEPANNLTVCC